MQGSVEMIVSEFVGVRRLELPTSTSRTWRAANCATPRTLCVSGAKLILFSQMRNSCRVIS